MIFYFSGTGNTWQAAMALRSEGEAVLSMADCVRQGRFHFTVGPEEPVGFFCPVYFGGLPSVAAEFLAKLRLSRVPSYCYGLFTCGGSSLGAGDMLSRALRKRGRPLHAVFTVKMVDNYVLMYDIPDAAEREKIRSRAGLWLEHIKKQVTARQRTDCRGELRDRLATAAIYPIYAKGRRTRKFYTNDKCIGCAVCVNRCPARAMTMENGRPKWVAERCIHCMSCIRCGAVEYGKNTVGRERYTNPLLKKKTASHSSHHHV